MGSNSADYCEKYHHSVVELVKKYVCFLSLQNARQFIKKGEFTELITHWYIPLIIITCDDMNVN